MTALPHWNRSRDPHGLVRYVQPMVAASLLHDLPPRAEGRGGGVLDRTRAVYDAVARAGVRYADEPLASGDGWQALRTASEVLAPPRLATCADLVLVFAGAFLDAGVHPLIVLLEPLGGGPAHALVVTWLGGTWTGVGGDAGYRWCAPEAQDDGTVLWPGELRCSVDGPGAFVPIDVVRAAAGAHGDDPSSFADAVRAGSRLLRSDEWQILTLIDVGTDYEPRGALRAERRPLSGIVNHGEMVAGLDGLQRNLLTRNLTYVPPHDPTSPVAPANLLDALRDPSRDRRGFLLVGAGGVGKTRTCFEVAELAVARGWAVLHVTVGEPPVTVTELHDAIVEARADTVLVIVDYLNESHLDLRALRHRVLPAAHRSGISVHVLASCRPGWAATTQAPVDLVFDRTHLEPDLEQVTRIRDTVIAELAPRAIAAIGLERLRELCGERPIIAMLIASEAERLAVMNVLAGAVAEVRPGQLVEWLHRRLREDDLVPAPAGNLFADEDAEPSLKVQASLAMLLAAPQPDADLVEAGHRVLDRSPATAGALLHLLRTMGWVVDGPAGPGPVHDLVTDHLVERVLLRPAPSGEVNATVAERVLTACLARGRSVGRFATNLGRAVRDLPTDHAGSLGAYCGQWLGEHATATGKVLGAGANEGSYALGAVMENPVWSPVAYASWDAVVAPWLVEHAQSLSARHLLFRGLRFAPSGARDPLVDEALNWLALHGAHAEAGFVLGPLLHRDLGTADATRAVEHALHWLDAHDTRLEAGYVLGRLLARALDEPVAMRTIEHAGRWLDAHDLREESRFVLSPLLARDLPDPTRVVECALSWLGTHGTRPDAGYLLGALLARPLDGPTAARAVERAMHWLDSHCAIEGAGYVLRPLLDSHVDDPADAVRVVGHALRWLDDHGTGTGAPFVLGPLLGTELADPLPVVDRALHWLERHHTLASAQFVLEPLIRRTTTDDRDEAVLDWATAWTEVNGSGSDLVTKALGRRRILTPGISAALVVWARVNPDDVDVPWRLDGVARGLHLWPEVTDELLRAVETVVAHAGPTTVLPNEQSQFDGLFNALSKSIGTGVAAARLDDLVMEWILRPEALSASCSEGTYFVDLVSRLCSCLLIDRRGHDVGALLDRLAEWTTQWRCSAHEESRALSAATIERYRDLLVPR